MTQTERTTDQWKVSARAPGEILTSAAHEQGIELGLLGVPAGYTVEEIRGWLHDLIGVARETTGNDTESRTIPPLLHHGLSGLLFSHEQLWNQGGQSNPASYAFVQSGGWVGFGWVGEVDAQVSVDGEAVVVDPIIVRDGMGREARAFVASESHALVVRLSWPSGAEEGTATSVVADWSGAANDIAADAPVRQEAAAAPIVEPVDARRDVSVESTEQRHPDVAGITVPVVESPVAEAPADRIHAPGIPGDLAEPAVPAQSEQPAPPITSDAHPAESDTPRNEAVAAMDVPASLDPSLATEAEASSDDATLPKKASGLRRMFARLAFWKRDEDDHVGAPAETLAETAMQMDLPAALFEDEMLDDNAGVPDQIPPTPEPAELTERAVGIAPGLPQDAAVAEPAPVSEPDQLVQPGPDALPDSPFFEIEAEATAAEVDVPPLTRSEVSFEDARPIQAQMPAETEQSVAPAEASIPVESAETDAPGGEPVTSDAVEIEVPVEEQPAPEVHAHAEQLEAEALVEPDSPAGRVPMHPAWPSAEELDRPTPLWKRPIAWGAVIAALFAGGWLVGNLQSGDPNTAGGTGVQGVLRGLGLGGAHFEVMVNSRPPGAWIAIDGEDIAQRTPASVAIPPGQHDITLSFSDHGSATYEVRGVDGDELSVDAVLWGSVNVYSSDQAVPVAVTVDGQPRGFAPLSVDSLAPGTHELRFSGPGLPSWGQTVQVQVQGETEVVARPMTSPATGLIEVRATLATPTGADPLEGARVWVDGRPEGVTPMSLELPRGPHSIRVTLGEESSPVQVIDLPGGNQRFAHFQLGLNSDSPRLQTIDPPAAVALDRSSVLAVSLDQVGITEVKEIWLHVQTTTGTWRRYEMAIMKAPDGVVGVTVFPNTQFDDKGLVSFYASARTRVGDEYYTEIQRAKAADR